jgi:hypothetical protein
VENESMQILLIIIMLVFFLTQVVALVGVWIALKKMVGTVERQRLYLEQNVTPIIADVRKRLDQAELIFDSLQKTMDNVAGVSEMIRTQAERVNTTIEETTTRVRAQIAKADEVISDVVEKIHITAVVVQQNVLAPIREVSAIIRGVTSAVQILFGRQRHPVDRVHQDEELFI